MGKGVMGRMERGRGPDGQRAELTLDLTTGHPGLPHPTFQYLSNSSHQYNFIIIVMIIIVIIIIIIMDKRARAAATGMFKLCHN